MKHILFVDDEPNILEGLQRMLRSNRDQWEMAFAQGGEAALTLMDASSFGVVEIIRIGAKVHDIGKMGIPYAILRKPGRLTAEELAMMRLHPEIGKRTGINSAVTLSHASG